MPIFQMMEAITYEIAVGMKKMVRKQGEEQ
jgi:hypothetical protein